MILQTQLCGAYEFGAQWEQLQVHFIDKEVCVMCENTPGDP